MNKIVHCKKEPYDIYIGRPSKYGNPFIIGKDGTRKEVIEKYREWILTQEHLIQGLDELKDKVLGCWCSPNPCHGDVLVELINRKFNMPKKLNKCVIFGDREIEDYSVLLEAVEKSGFKIDVVISGGARGSDKLGEQYALKNKLKLEVFEADWDNIDVEDAIVKTNTYGKQYNAKAGFDRNEKMAIAGTCGIGLQVNGNSNGTQDMKKRLEKLGKPVFILGPKVDENEKIQF